MLRKSVSFNEFIQIVKQAYVTTAEQQLLKSDGKATTSRIAIVTGLTRKDVSQIRKTPQNVESISTKYNRSIRVINGWLEDKEFCTPGGFPAVLPIHGKEQSFEALVEKYSGNMTTRAMLDELEKAGIVKKIEKEHICLQKHAHIPSSDEDELLGLLGTDVALLLSTFEHNLLVSNDKPEEARFQRKVCYDNLPDECLSEFKHIANKQNQQVLESLNRWLKEQDRDYGGKNATGSGRNRAGVGIYYFEEKIPKDLQQK